MTRRGWLLLLDVALGIAILGMILAIFVHLLEVYLVFLGEQPEVTAAAIGGYETRALVGVILAVAAVGQAVLRRRVGGSITFALLLVMMVATIVAFAVPDGRWTDGRPAPVQDWPNTSCMSGSNDCVGG